jgi:hypothetical protein
MRFKNIINQSVYVIMKFMKLTVQAVVRMQVRNISMTAAYWPTPGHLLLLKCTACTVQLRQPIKIDVPPIIASIVSTPASTVSIKCVSTGNNSRPFVTVVSHQGYSTDILQATDPEPIKKILERMVGSENQLICWDILQCFHQIVYTMLNGRMTDK